MTGQDAPQAGEKMWRLCLYVAGQSLSSMRARDNLTSLCARHLGDRCDVHIIDLLERPGLAESAGVIVTPTLIRESPAPMRKVIGDLSDEKRVLFGLGIPPGSPGR